VSPFPNGNSKWQVSRGGGEEPRWSGNGKELFYLSGEGKMMLVEVKAGGTFETGLPVILFQRRAEFSDQHASGRAQCGTFIRYS
jgi:hypothetical protein